MRFRYSLSFRLTLLAVTAVNGQLLTDVNLIQGYWGQVSPYHDNAENHFGVNVTGLPDGCQVEQAHLLQRHADRFPTSGEGQAQFASKVTNFTKAHPDAHFTGPLSFLNSYQYELIYSLLTGHGASTEFNAGVTFWNRYGRTLYNATVGQVAYNAIYQNGTARRKPVLRTTSQSRIWNSEINWALGFFGTSFQTVPDPTLAGFTAPYDVVIIPEGGTENNTLTSYDSCFNDNLENIGYLGDQDVLKYLPKYLGPATARMQQYAPTGFTFNYNDTYAMQSICSYETAYLGVSDFCSLFTQDEWANFEQTLDILYYYDYAWGNPTGRAQGIGYVQELVARLTNQYITLSNSSINFTIDNNAADFPLGEPFYADFTHDDIIVSTLTALSVDYFHDPPLLNQIPPNPARHFVLSNMTPFGGRLVTEVIGCKAENPTSLPDSAPSRVQYYPTQYGYDPENAPHKFIRMRLNNGIVPLATIKGGMCANSRPDAMCGLGSFLESQANAYALSNYQYACFGNYTLPDPTNGEDYDGTIFA